LRDDASGGSMMSAAEQVGAILLRLIRRRRLSRTAAADFDRDSARAMPTTLREVRFSDFPAVAALKERWGLGKDTRENWSRLWERNPAMRTAGSQLKMGWVLETERGIVGYQGSVPLQYRLGERELLVATGSGLVVEPAYRGRSMGLLASFYGQPGVDLLLITTASPSVKKLCHALRAKTLPQRDYGRVLFWVLDVREFAKAVVIKARLRGALSGACVCLGSLAVRADTYISRRRAVAKPEGFCVTEFPLEMIGDEFETFWRRKLAERPRLLVDRSPLSLKWHFMIPGRAPTTWVLSCRRSDRLLGYAIVHHVTDPETGLRRSMLADLLVAHDDRRVTTSLLVAAFEHSARTNNHVFEVLGFPQEVRQILLQWRPYVRDYRSCPFLYKAANGSLNEPLADETTWYAGPLDGDTTLTGLWI
jgi:hypothetical protein